MQPKEKHPMTRALSPITAALCLAAAAITAAQAGPITLPLVNADFNTVYKPGSTSVTATSFNGGWGYTDSVGSGVSITSPNLYANFTDGENGTTIDIPGWVSVGSKVGIQNTGNYEFNAYANGQDASGNGGTLTQTLAGITTQPNDIYTLSADLSGASEGCPTTFSFYLAGTEIIAMNPLTWYPDGTSNRFTQQYQFTGAVPVTGDLKVVFTFGTMRRDPPWYGATQTRIDNVVLTVPEPAALSLLGLGALGCLGRGRRRG